MTLRESILTEAAELITGDRNVTYGSPTQNFQDTADLWTTLISHKLKDGERFTAGEVASFIIALKLARMKAQPKRDNWTDIAGYAGCGYEADVNTGVIDQPNSSELTVKPAKEWEVGYRFEITTETPAPPRTVQAIQSVYNPGFFLVRNVDTWASALNSFGDNGIQQYLTWYEVQDGFDGEWEVSRTHEL